MTTSRPVDLLEIVDAYCAAWNEGDDAKRRALLESSWADKGTYTDPTAHVEGRDALDAHIAGFTERMPGHRIDPTSWVDEHHGWFRFSWKIVGPDGATVLEGFDVGEQAADGRIARIVGFFGAFRVRDERAGSPSADR
jgi:hypothetical protein